jgi:flavin-binding protein dodecin
MKTNLGSIRCCERRAIKIVKVIELMSESPESCKEAAENVVQEAAKTLRNIR